MGEFEGPTCEDGGVLFFLLYYTKHYILGQAILIFENSFEKFSESDTNSKFHAII